MPATKGTGRGKAMKVKQETLPTPQGRRVIPRVTSTRKAEACKKAGRQRIKSEDVVVKMEFGGDAENAEPEEELGLVARLGKKAKTQPRVKGLRPNPLITPDVIDVMIEGEKSEAKEGYQARIKSLETMKDRATIISKVAKREELNKTDEQLSEEKQKNKEKKGFFKKMGHFFGY